MTEPGAGAARGDWPPTVRAGLLGLALLVVLAASRLAPIQDETYYWTWSRAPALEYVDHPPVVAWILAGSTGLFGDGWLGLRIPTLLAMITTLIFVARAARRLGAAEPRRSAELACVFLLGAPMFLIGYLPATPDPFQGAAAAACAFFVVRALDERDPMRGLFAFRAGLGLVASLLVKHSSALLALGALAGLGLTGAGRRALRSPWPWAGAALGLVLIAPWLVEDLSSAHGSLAFQADRVFSRGVARGPLAVPVLVGGLMLALGPSTGLALPAFAARGLARREGAAKTALYGGALLLILACLVPVWLGGGELNWSMPALVFAAPALAADVAERWGRPLHLALAGGAVLATAILAVVLVHIAWPFLPIPPGRDTTRRGVGFDHVAREAESLAEAVGARSLVTRRYQLASELRYHTEDRWPVLELGTPRASQYDAWPRPALCAGDRAVLVLLDGRIPEDLAAVPLEGVAPRTVSRRSEGETIETFVLTPVVAVEAASNLPRSACRGAEGARTGGAT